MPVLLGTYPETTNLNVDLLLRYCVKFALTGLPSAVCCPCLCKFNFKVMVVKGRECSYFSRLVVHRLALMSSGLWMGTQWGSHALSWLEQPYKDWRRLLLTAFFFLFSTYASESSFLAHLLQRFEISRCRLVFLLWSLASTITSLVGFGIFTAVWTMQRG